MGLSVSDYERKGTRYVFDSLILRNNQRGIESFDGADVTVTNALVQGNTRHGILAYGGAMTVVNSTIDRNPSGVSGWQAGGASVRIDVENTIFSNSMRAIDLDQGGGPPVVATVARSTFWTNVQTLLTRHQRRP